LDVLRETKLTVCAIVLYDVPFIRSFRKIAASDCPLYRLSAWNI